MPHARATLKRVMGCLSLAAAACAPFQPARWAEGGAALQLAPAAWVQPGQPTLELRANGQVFQDGELQFTVDAHGRVTDSNGEPYALLDSDGHLFTSDDVYSGRVGLRNASPPWQAVAWLHLDGGGDVLWFDADGQAHRVGRWSGCEGPALRTCTLVTHLALLSGWYRDAASSAQFLPDPYPPYDSPRFGVEFGLRGSP